MGSYKPIAEDESRDGHNQQYKTFVEYLAQSSTALKDRYETLRAFIEALGDDVQSKQLLYYIAFRRLKNFACVEIGRKHKAFWSK
jgi:Domain of unknown function (DUF5655)